MSEEAMQDRFEGTYAVLFVGKKSRRLNVPSQLVPKQAREGARLIVIFDGNELQKIEIDHKGAK